MKLQDILDTKFKFPNYLMQIIKYILVRMHTVLPFKHVCLYVCVCACRRDWTEKEKQKLQRQRQRKEMRL